LLLLRRKALPALPGGSAAFGLSPLSGVSLSVSLTHPSPRVADLSRAGRRCFEHVVGVLSTDSEGGGLLLSCVVLKLAVLRGTCPVLVSLLVSFIAAILVDLLMAVVRVSGSVNFDQVQFQSQRLLVDSGKV
jgi:hypothetical protein